MLIKLANLVVERLKIKTFSLIGVEDGVANEVNPTRGEQVDEVVGGVIEEVGVVVVSVHAQHLGWVSVPWRGIPRLWCLVWVIS